MKNHFSKSKYCRLWQCPKMLWMDKYKPEEKTEDATDDSRMEAGTEVGKLARELFGKPVDVTETVNGQLNLPAMTDRTQVEIEHETSVICEASFSYQGCYCAVDILKRENDGWAIYEVKSSTVNEKNMKAVYVADVAYQKYVLEHCGVRITGTYIVSINNDYVYDGKLDLERLFQITDVSEFVRNEIGEVEKNLLQEDTLLESENEPERELGLYCKDPYGCPYWEYCAKELPTPSVFDLYRMPLKKKLEYYREGNSDYRQLKDCGKIKNEKQLRQIEFALEDKGTYVNIDGIREFLSTLSYPLYFLDFETMQPVIPLFPGTKPYQQIPFQYSLHYMKYTERLKLRDYVEIIAGAPVSLKRKQGLLHKLRATTDLKQRDMEYMKLCCECMNQAVRYLTMESRTIFLIQLMGYDDDNKSDIMDGPYIMTSLEDMKKAVQEYYWNDFDSTWETLYWLVELYLDSKNEIKKNEFLSPMYTYIMDKAGEIQYFIHEKLSLNYLKGPLGSMVERQFYSVCPDLNLPVPYQPGDVLLIDCRPYAPGAFYCLLKEVGDDCCGIQCEYVNPKGEIETGALKHGDYFFNHREVYQYLSPLYKARIVSKDELDWNDYIKGKRKC